MTNFIGYLTFNMLTLPTPKTTRQNLLAKAWILVLRVWLCQGDYLSGKFDPFSATYSNSVLLNAANSYMGLCVQLYSKYFQGHSGGELGKALF